MPITHDYTEPFIATPNSVIESSAVNTVHESIRHLKDFLPDAEVGEIGKVLTVIDEDDVDWADPNVLVDGVPIGTIAMFGGGAAPTGWLFCQGQTVSRSTYAALFAVIGTTYGAGDGSTTFVLPYLVDLFPVGAGNLYALGASGGAATTSLSGITFAASAATGGNPYDEDETGDGHTTVEQSHGHNITPSGSTSILPPYRAVHFMIKTGL